MIEKLAYALLALVQLGFFVRWLHCRLRDEEIQRSFVRDVAANHLPHIYQALRLIAAKQGIQLEEAPPIQFVRFNGDKKT